MEEQWLPVAGFEGWYEVSNLGRVRRARPGKATHVGRILKAWEHQSNRGLPRMYTSLTKDGVEYPKHVAALVAHAFLGPTPKGLEINHIDYDPLNNRADNLEYVTHSYNTLHAYRNGFVGGVGERHASAKLTIEKVRTMRAEYTAGSSKRSLARKYGVTVSTVRNALLRVTWKHVP